MTFAASIDPNRYRGQPTSISDWSFDRLVGQINARDERGNLVMAIAADPQFGLRLAAAFDSLPRPARFVERTYAPPPYRPSIAAIPSAMPADTRWRMTTEVAVAA